MGSEAKWVRRVMHRNNPLSLGVKSALGRASPPVRAVGGTGSLGRTRSLLVRLQGRPQLGCNPVPVQGGTAISWKQTQNSAFRGAQHNNWGWFGVGEKACQDGPTHPCLWQGSALPGHGAHSLTALPWDCRSVRPRLTIYVCQEPLHSIQLERPDAGSGDSSNGAIYGTARGHS